MPPFASEQSLPVGPDGSLSIMQVIQVMGCLIIFIIGFSFVACKMCCVPPSSIPDGHSFPACQHKHQYPSARFGRTSPTASIPKCPACQKAELYTTADKSARVSQRSPLCLPPAPPYFARRGPTGVGPRVQSWRPAIATPTTPPSPPLGYGARGPTASLRPVVW